MGKKKKKKMVTIDQFLEVDALSKKKINKKFKKAVQDYEETHIMVYEKKKKHKKHKEKKALNNEERSFYYECEDIKKKNKKNKKWENKGFFEKALDSVNTAIPIVKTAAKLLSLAITAVISIPIIRDNISVKTLNKIAAVYNMAAAV